MEQNLVQVTLKSEKKATWSKKATGNRIPIASSVSVR